MSIVALSAINIVTISDFFNEEGKEFREDLCKNISKPLTLAKQNA
jgi:hypothetical protein